MKTAAWLQLLLVGFGGFLGSILRFAVSGYVHRVFPFQEFPAGTLAVNLLGCLAIGFLGGLVEIRQALTPEHRLFLMIGVLGGFTTFSSFAFETFALAQDSEMLKATGNVMAQCVLGFIAVWIGYVGARCI